MAHAENDTLGIGEDVMAEMTGYAQPLRAIGQALEVLNIQDFEMEPVGEDYFVRGHMPQADKKIMGDPIGAEKLDAIWGRVPVRNDPGDALQRDAATLSPIELRYTAQDIERLEEEGRLHRGRSEVKADAATVSQVLRGIGSYLNQKRARLCKITRDVDLLVVEYESSIGSIRKEAFAPNDLYDLWVRMYMQRSTRPH
jgi:hypothetical protein